MNRPITTLFMLMSVDGKITAGATDDLDFDKDLPHIPGVKEGLQQYYDIEQTTDLWSLNSGRVQAKIGVNVEAFPQKTQVSFVVIDNHHLTDHGVRYFCALSNRFVLVTSNKKHPAYTVDESNLHIIFQDKLDLHDMLRQLKADYGCERITIQTGGTLNGMFLREKLFDYLDIVVAPLLVGGKDTTTLIDGDALLTSEQLCELGVLELESVQMLDASYVRLRYKVVSWEVINHPYEGVVTFLKQSTELLYQVVRISWFWSKIIEKPFGEKKVLTEGSKLIWGWKSIWPAGITMPA